MLTREMSITHKEFLRLLPLAVQGASVNRRDNLLTVKTASGRLTITLAPQTTRKLGLLEFPVTTVTMEFHDFNPSDQAAFLKRFDLAYQRGGG